MHDEKNRMIASMASGPDQPSEPSDTVHLAGELKRAIDSGDPHAIAEAFEAMVMACSQPMMGG